MKFLVPLILLTSFSAWSAVEKEISGNIEAQARHTWNNEEARQDLFQDWDEEQFYLIYGNLNAKLNFEDSRIESNLFARYSKSDLYEERPAPLPPYVAPLFFTFPNRLVVRDLFRLQHDKRVDEHREELILNKFYYESNFGEHRYMFGRMYINFGRGEMFNPINPFNQPTGLTTVSQVAQGNDGFNFKYFANDKHTIDLYLLGDKSFNDYEGSIEETVWIHGEYLVSNELQLNYVGGQDLNRYKVGGQFSYNFSEASFFLQTLYQTEYIDYLDSDHLWDVMFGYDQQVTNKWHVRIEGGHQKMDSNLNLDITLSDRFLPSEYFIAIANQYEIHPLVKLGGTIVNDIKTGFTYFITRNTLDLGHDTEAEIFAYVPAVRGSNIQNPAQKIVTTDIGMSLRTFF